MGINYDSILGYVGEYIKGLPWRYDNALYTLGRNIEDIKPFEIKIRNLSKIEPVFQLGGMIDVFEICRYFSHYKKAGLSLDIIDIIVEDEKHLDIIKDFLGSQKLPIFIYTKNNLQGYNQNYKKYLQYEPDIKIPVYCPLEYNQIDSWRDEWFNTLHIYQNEKKKHQ